MNATTVSSINSTIMSNANATTASSVNTTGSIAGAGADDFNFISAYAEPFFEFLKKNLLPYLIFILKVVVLIVSSALNGAYLHMCKKLKKFSEPVCKLTINLLVIDLIAISVVGIPSGIASVASLEQGFFGFCYVHGYFVEMIFLNSFTGLMLLSMERCLVVCYPNHHTKIFGNSTIVLVMIVGSWVFNGVVASIPLWGLTAPIAYHPSQYQCNIDFVQDMINTILYLVYGYFIPIIFGIVTMSIIIHKRRSLIREASPSEGSSKGSTQNLIKMADLKNEKERPKSSSKDSMGSKETTLTVDDVEAESPRVELATKPSVIEEKPKISKIQKGNKRWKKLASEREKIFTLGELDDQHKEFHFAFTVLLIWVFALLTWAPFVGIVLYKVFTSSVETWSGWWTTGVLIVDIWWVIKPLVYLSHNKQIKEEVEMSLPKQWTDKANKVKRKVAKTVSAWDKVFHQAFRRKINFFNVSLAIKAVRRWKRFVKRKKQRRLIEERREMKEKAAELKEATEKENVEIPGAANYTEGPIQ
ncbi:unnamed protein product [Owenia fusiformis]|uniref:Uncharacterized protein n=1 Tax=Owenia fusiformis TaxID=6347 RepID=A0A8J1XRE7_OWEFU|nr:unnamed protein product [Owenia fusiformis]